MNTPIRLIILKKIVRDMEKSHKVFTDILDVYKSMVHGTYDDLIYLVRYSSISSELINQASILLSDAIDEEEAIDALKNILFEFRCGLNEIYTLSEKRKDKKYWYYGHLLNEIVEAESVTDKTFNILLESFNLFESDRLSLVCDVEGPFVMECGYR